VFPCIVGHPVEVVGDDNTAIDLLGVYRGLFTGGRAAGHVETDPQIARDAWRQDEAQLAPRIGLPVEAIRRVELGDESGQLAVLIQIARGLQTLRQVGAENGTQVAEVDIDDRWQRRRLRHGDLDHGVLALLLGGTGQGQCQGTEHGAEASESEHARPPYGGRMAAGSKGKRQ